MNCPFCNINKEKIKVVKEGESAFVFLSNPRLVEGHLLVAPKRHLENISELNEKEKKEIFELLIYFQKKILDNIAEGCDIRCNYRPFIKGGNLKVNHLHFHLIPRSFEDELYTKSQKVEKDIFKELTEEEINKVFKSLDR